MSRLDRIALRVVDVAEKGYRDENYLGGRAEINYYSIGHNEDRPVLWVWDGSLHQETLTPNDDLSFHSDYWGEEYMAFHYTGRYSPRTRSISIRKPERFRFRGVPDGLIRDLELGFPEADVAYVFD